MSLNLNKATFQNSLATLPLVTYQAGETVIADGSQTGRLLILSKGTVVIVKQDTEIAKVAEPGAVFGELSVLLNQPHTADVPLSIKNWTHQKNPALRWWGWQIPKFQWRLSNPAPFKAMHFRHELVLFLRQRPPNTSILKKRPMQSEQGE